MKRITIDLPDEIYRELKIRCATGGITMSNVVRELLEKILTGRSMDRNFMETMRKIESENNEIKDALKEKEESRRKFFAGLKKSGKKP